ncbi:hypothetical protein J433_08340 [Corynebacterium glutamicum MT]|uniref:Transposase n=1 Tax=Corynebacterium glutamicum TaxID=1718 RepID=A0AB36IE68_CORGT|nr:hypothetical protein C624_13145 [Corynebacterium glutamicum SCgG1]AGN23220.1 hypothetical protein C629_13150 [Corynebacterium glutamicum SCgG2]EGV41926.1 hypothetical protein CgS9114_00875 [Corynebacterium glutamicum S9114]EOA64776.1 hypothetical protein J433_08340 [Corynebacterium glutamicum MT]EPP39625.1 hypothetical protein A583_12684 [Corynebacterium glutamicum Z188]OKX81414.1 hypothetical protein AUP70_02120 [Corynebacterium glutamicum]
MAFSTIWGKLKCPINFNKSSRHHPVKQFQNFRMVLYEKAVALPPTIEETKSIEIVFDCWLSDTTINTI